jgi:hypothetical protein
MRRVFLTIPWTLLALLFACSPDSPAPAIKPPDEAAAIATLKEVNQAQENFIRRTRRYAFSFEELVAEHLLAAEPKEADIGYDFDLRPSADAVSYTLTAKPVSAGARHFFTDNTKVLRAEKDKPATATSPAF